MTQMNLSMKQKQTHRHRGEIVVAKREKGCGGTHEKCGISRWRLSHREKAMRPYCLAQGAAFYIVMNCIGKEHGGEPMT